MKSTNTGIGPLITVLMTVVGISMALGQYDRLKAFAARESVKASRGWKMVRFFPSTKF